MSRKHEIAYSWWDGARVTGEPCPRCRANAVRSHIIEDWSGLFGVKEEHRCNRCRTTWLEDITDPIKAGAFDATTLGCFRHPSACPEKVAAIIEKRKADQLRFRRAWRSSV